MIAEIGEAFVLLANGPQPHGSQLATRRIGTSSGSDVRVGIDKDRFRHLLIEVDHDVEPLNTSAALTVSPYDLEVDGHVKQFVDLHCSDTRLALVFEKLAHDVTSRVDGGLEVTKALPAALDEWRDLFKSAPQGISTQQIVGLLGELHVLGQLAMNMGPVNALETWWGPSGHTHDFYAPDGGAIEVKATRTLEGNRIHVSNVDQLDPSDVSSLHLVVVHLKADLTAPSLDERIDQLLASGFPAAELLGRVQEGGHSYESPTTVNTRFKIRSSSWWSVDDHFPGLRASRLSPEARKGVSDVEYSLSLDSVGSPIRSEAITRLLANWGRP